MKKEQKIQPFKNRIHLGTSNLPFSIYNTISSITIDTKGIELSVAISQYTRYMLMKRMPRISKNGSNISKLDLNVGIMLPELQRIYVNFPK